VARLIVMLVISLAIRVIGFTGWWAQANSWRGALRVALAGMFCSRPCRIRQRVC
jgi:hypothetical protein